MKWRSAHLGNDRASQELYQQMVAEFKQVYQNSLESKGMALYELTDCGGMLPQFI